MSGRAGYKPRLKISNFGGGVLQIIFFAGKGGVGKTSVAAATGIRSAEMGKRTLVMSLDVAHSLADIFDLDRSLFDLNKGRPCKVADNLFIQEIDIQEEIGRNWRRIHGYFSRLLSTSGLDDVLAEEMAVFPGMEEISLLLYLNHYVRKNRFDAILLDCAPTGESLRFIGLPTTLEWYMKKIFNLERSIAKVARPVAKRLYGLPLPDEDYFEALAGLYDRLRGVDQVIADPMITSVRLVATPEKVVLKETQRAFMYFCMFRMCIDTIVLNRVLPQAVAADYFSGGHLRQQRLLKEAETMFQPVPIVPVPMFGTEVIGYESLKALAEQIYGDRDPLERSTFESPYHLTKENGTYTLKLRLPFLDKGQVDLHKTSSELILRIGGYRRHILLPKQVAAREHVKGRVEAPYLVISLT
jgi:arsenite-transporting ATPase